MKAELKIHFNKNYSQNILITRANQSLYKRNSVSGRPDSKEWQNINYFLDGLKGGSIPIVERVYSDVLINSIYNNLKYWLIDTIWYSEYWKYFLAAWRNDAKPVLNFFNRLNGYYCERWFLKTQVHLTWINNLLYNGFLLLLLHFKIKFK